MRACLDAQTIADCDDRCGRYGQMCRVWAQDKRKAADEHAALLQVAGAARSWRVSGLTGPLTDALDQLDRLQGGPV